MRGAAQDTTGLILDEVSSILSTDEDGHVYTLESPPNPIPLS
jgi:hypothetical protein